MAHMKKIEALPGEAVLDFPFCILGGNGDTAYLCPFMERLKSVYALQRFHHKKVIGQYLGRVHPTQTKPFVDQGWPKMWDTDDSDPIKADKQLRCLTDAESEGCPEQFYARHGQPMGTVSIPKAGRLAFIPRRAETFSRLDPEGAKQIRYTVVLSSAAETIAQRRPLGLDFNGLSGYEWLGDANNDFGQHWRWAVAPQTDFIFNTTLAREIVLEADYLSPIPGQVVTVTMDCRVVQTLDDLPLNERSKLTLRTPVAPGEHTLQLRYKYANAGLTEFTPKDPRALTMRFWSLTLRADPLRQ